MVELHVSALLGLVIRGSGQAMPADLGRALVPGAVDNPRAYELLLGADWMDQLKARGWAAAHSQERFGIRSRQWSRVPGSQGETQCDVLELGVCAAQRALKDADWEPASCDILLAASSTPSELSASMAARIAARLEIECACMDVRAGGCGGISAWISAASLLHSGAKRALVVAADCPSLYLPREPLSLALVYGDGAAAICLERGGAADGGLLGAGLGRLTGQGQAFTVAPFLHNLNTQAGLRFVAPDRAYRQRLEQVWNQTCRARAEQPKADLFVPYAVSAPQVAAAAQACGYRRDQVLSQLETQGCTGAASALLALHGARASGLLGSTRELEWVAVAGGIHWAWMRWRQVAC